MNLFKYYFSSSIEQLSHTFLSKIEYGKLNVKFPSGSEIEYNSNNEGLNADIKLNNYNLFYKLLKKGSVGFAESYMDGDFASKDLSKLLQFAHQNELSYLKQKKTLH